MISFLYRISAFHDYSLPKSLLAQKSRNAGTPCIILSFYSFKIQTLDQCEVQHARPVCLRSNEMFALSVHDGANVNQLQCRSGSLFLAFALISVERRTLDYHSVHLLKSILIRNSK